MLRRDPEPSRHVRGSSPNRRWRAVRNVGGVGGHARRHRGPALAEAVRLGSRCRVTGLCLLSHRASESVQLASVAAGRGAHITAHFAKRQPCSCEGRPNEFARAESRSVAPLPASSHDTAVTPWPARRNSDRRPSPRRRGWCRGRRHVIAEVARERSRGCRRRSPRSRRTRGRGERAARPRTRDARRRLGPRR
jgi:hypothetical protein